MMGIENFEQQMSLFGNIARYSGMIALLFLVVAGILFFKLRIPDVFAEFTGKKARRAVKDMGEKRKEEKTQSSGIYEDVFSGKSNTDKLSRIGLPRQESYVADPQKDVETMPLNFQNISDKDQKGDMEETVYLDESWIEENITQDLTRPDPEFMIEKSIVVIHTSEVIGNERS